jgi:hypothetical protein
MPRTHLRVTIVVSSERSDMNNDDGLGAKFWLTALGAILGFAIGGILLFSLLGAVWYRWGAFGALLVGFGLILGVAYFVDRRRTNAYDDASA